MARDIVLGNQRMLVNVDRWLQIRDVFYPRVGQYNHLSGRANKMCIICEDDAVSFINDESWDKKLDYVQSTLITNNEAYNKDLGLRLNFNETVHCSENIFLRKIVVHNLNDKKRRLRLCFSHDFHINENGIGDTALFHPEKNAIIHYKNKSYFLMGLCKNFESIHFDYATGENLFPSKDLGKNPIAQGDISSIMGVDLEVESKSSQELCYYMIAGDCFDTVFEIQKSFLEKGHNYYISSSEKTEKDWLSKSNIDLSSLNNNLSELYRRSLLIIKTQIDNDGAIIAANDSDNMKFNKDTYSYMWPRDGALVAITMIKAGYPEIARKFFDFCSEVLYKEGCLLHKYNPNKSLGSSWHPWVLNNNLSLPIQEDETALVLHALSIYYEYTQDITYIKEIYPSFIKSMGDFLSKYSYDNGLPKESYDLWEERRGIFTFTTSAVLSGLIAAEKFGHMIKDEEFCEACNLGFNRIRDAMGKFLYNEKGDYFRRGVSFESEEIKYDDAIDASCYGIFEFGTFDINDKRVKSTMEKFNNWLSVKTDIGGFARYHNDKYFQKSKDIDNVPGNPWFICTLWYAKYIIKKAKEKEHLSEALSLLEWVSEHALGTGAIAEQIDPYTGEPLSVSPLTWSHAEFVDTIIEYTKKESELR